MRGVIAQLKCRLMWLGNERLVGGGRMQLPKQESEEEEYIKTLAHMR